MSLTEARAGPRPAAEELILAFDDIDKKIE